MEIIYSGLVSVAVAVLTFLLKNVISENRKLKNEKEHRELQKNKAMENGMTCLLRKELIADHDKFIKDDTISHHDYENWIEMYHAYKDLGGNGVVEHMYNDIEEIKMSC